MKNLFYTLFIVGFVVSCGTENKPTYKVTTTVSPTEGGTITLSPSDGVYSEDEVVTMTGTPSNGWRFVRWEGDLSSTQNPSTITMNKNYSVVGVFEKRNYPLTINIEGYGEVQERVVQQKTTEYPFQTVVELTPVPDEGWKFVEWSGDLSGNEVPKQITVDGEKTVTAKFERKNYPLTINIVGEGTVKETVLPQKTTEYPYQTVVILESIPSEGWEFVSWSGDLSGNENPQMIVVDEDKSVTATFQLKTYPLNVSVVGNGTVGVEPLLDVYPHGSTVTLTPVPDDGWEFVEWSGDVSGTTVPLVVTVTSELDVVGTFQRKNYPLTVTIVGEGTVTETIIPQKTTDYPYETIVELTPKPSNGWFFWNYRDDLSGNKIPQMIIVDVDKNVTITFIRKGTIDELYLYSYDSNNNLIEILGFNSDGSISFRLTSSYDFNNNLIETIEYDSDGINSFRVTNSYDSNNNIIERIEYDSDGSISYRDTYSYDSNNNLIERIEYDSDGSFIVRWTNSYDSNNNLIETIGYNSDGIFVVRWTSSYDSNNNLIEAIGYNSDGSIFDRRTYSYDSNNNLIETIGYNSDGSISYRDTYSYDSNNNLIEETWYVSGGSIFSRYTYSYDLNNNLIEAFGYAFVSNKSNSTIQIYPFNDFVKYKIKPHDRLTLYPRLR